MNKALTKTLLQPQHGPKRAIQVGFDVLAMALCFWLVMLLQLDGIATTLQPQSWAALLAVIPVTIAAFLALGLYRTVIHFMADRALKTASIGVAVSAVTMFATSRYHDFFVPRSVPCIYFALLLIVTDGTRMIMRSIYLTFNDERQEPVLPYGVDDVGDQLLQALDQSRSYRPAILMGDDKKMHGANIVDLRVIHPAIAAHNIKASDHPDPEYCAVRISKLLRSYSSSIRKLENRSHGSSMASHNQENHRTVTTFGITLFD